MMSVGIELEESGAGRFMVKGGWWWKNDVGGDMIEVGESGVGRFIIKGGWWWKNNAKG